MMMLFACFCLALPAVAAPPDEIIGELDVIHKDDFDNHVHFDNDYFLRDDNGVDWHQLKFDREPPAHFRSGHRIKVKGQHRGAHFQVESMEELGVVGDKKNTTSSTADSSTVSAALTVDERKAIVILVDLTNAKTGSYTTPAQVAGQMFTNVRSVDGLYRTTSQGKTAFPADTNGDGNPDVFGPYSINYDNSNCDYYGWATAAEQAAQNAGIDLSLYRHRVFVLPTYSSLPACGWAGVANVGCGTYCRAWIAEANSGMVYAHELGHNLNMAHAGTDPENDGIINSEYGDYSDPMGLSRNWMQFNASHINQMGWYAGYPGAIATVTSSGTFNLSAIGLDPTTAGGVPFMLKITKPNSGDIYYLSYRQPIGDYNQLSTTYTQGVNIHRYFGSGYAQTSHVKTLIDGESFNDSVNGITFTQVSHGSNSASVQVSFGCAAASPVAAVSPSTLAVQTGNAAIFNVNVTNKDSNSCSDTSFSLSYAGGVVSGLLATTELLLLPGQMGNSGLTVDTHLTDGSYALKITASDNDGQDPSHTSVQATATLLIDNTSPSTPTGLNGSTNRQGSMVLSWQASTDQGSGIASYSVYRNGTEIGTTTTNSYTDSTVASGASYDYDVRAKDKAGNVSLPSNPVLLTAGVKKGGGKR